MLFESNPHPMWVFDTETLAFLAVNRAAVEHYGYSREEFLGMTIADIRPPEEAERLIAAPETTTGRANVAGVAPPAQGRRRDRRRGARRTRSSSATARPASSWPPTSPSASAPRRRCARATSASARPPRQLRRLNEMKNAFLTARLARASDAAHLRRRLRGHAGALAHDGHRRRARADAASPGENARKLDRLLTDLLDVDRLTRGILSRA